MSKTLTLPHRFDPREYQVPLLRARDEGFNRLLCIWHRRAGKDKSVFGGIVVKEMLRRVGNYYYFFPTYRQGKKILWEGKDKTGMPFLDHIPRELIDGKPNSSEMKLKLKNGSLFQVVGTDNYNDIMGTNPVGCVFSEYSLQDPRAWDYIRPILVENGGWAIFIYTPRGKNHGHALYQMALDNPDWYVSHLTITDTGAISPADVQAEREAGMDEDLIQQEFYCSFEGAVVGAYYSHQLSKAREEGRIGKVPHQVGFPVHTWWDIGVSDATAIWFTQHIGHYRHFIDYYEASGEGVQHYITKLQEKREELGYVYGTHNGPHDIRAREWTADGKSRLDVAKELGIDFNVVTNQSLAGSRDVLLEGIDAGRRIFNRCVFDKEKCAHGLDALDNYRKEWDEKNKCFKDRPFHDWSSHGADAYRVFALGEGLTLIREDIRTLVGATNRGDDWDPRDF